MSGEQKKLRKVRERGLREEDRAKVRALRADLRRAKKQRAARLRKLRHRIKGARRRLSSRTKDFRAEWRDWVNKQVGAMRARAKAAWTARLAKGAKVGQKAVDAAQAKLEAERDYQEELRRAARWGSAQMKARPKRAAWIAKAESDQQVEDNLPAELRPVWRRMKSRIKTRVAHKSRTEAFLEWAAENEDEILATAWGQDEQAKLERELAEAEAAAYREAEAAAVPF